MDNDKTEVPAPAEGADLGAREAVAPSIPAQPYIDTGLPVFPVAPWDAKCKKPGKEPYRFERGGTYQWGGAELPFVEIDWPQPSNIGLRLDRHIEVDPDDPNAARFTAFMFASMPTFTWGRKSRPAKRLYAQASSGEVAYSGHYFAPNGEKVMTIEVKAGAGHYTILPPGKHASEELIEGEWCEPATAEITEVVEKAKQVNMMCMLRAFWTDGTRNVLTTALARVLHEHGKDVSIELAASIVRNVAASAGDRDAQKRYDEAKSAATRAEDGKKIFGVPKLIEVLGEANVKILLEAIGATEEEAWDDPENPWDLTPAAPIPDDTLPPKLAARAHNLSDTTGTQYPHAVLYGIAGLAIAAGAHWRVRANEEFWQPLSVYGAVVDISGGGKSIAARMLDPLQEIEMREELRYKIELRAWHVRKKAQSKDKKAPDPGPKPEPPWILTVNATTEGVLRANRNNPQGGGMAPDEVSGVLLGCNQYKGKGDDDETLKMVHDGKLHRSTRKDVDASNLVTHPCISIFGGIQPDRLHEVLLTDGNVSSGTAARFSLSCYHPPVAVRAKPGARHDAFAATAWHDLLFALRNKTYPHWEEVRDPCELELRLSPEAADAFFTWSDQFAEVVVHTPPPLGPVWSKYRGFVLRLAGLFHLAESEVTALGQQPDGTPNVGFTVESRISGSCMERAIRFVMEYLLPHSRRLYAVADEAGGRTAGLLLAERILRRRETEITVNDLVKADLKWVANRATITAAMRFLELHGWGRISNTRRGGKGQVVGTKLTVNPKVHDGRFAAHGSGGIAPPLDPR